MMTPQSPPGGRQDDATAPAGPAQAAPPDPAGSAASRSPDDNAEPWLPECSGAGGPWTRTQRGPLACMGCGAVTDGYHALPAPGDSLRVPPHPPGNLPVRLVNEADWDEPYGARPAHDGLVIVNATRPLSGPHRWTGQFRAGTLYAAAPASDAAWESWRRDDARLIVFITDAQIRAACAAKARDKYGYATLADAEADGAPIEVWAQSLQLPWHGHDGE